MFVVAEFRGTDGGLPEVECIPHNWVLPDRKECYWPKSYPYEKLTASIKKCKPPEPTWSKYQMIWRYETETYEEAKAKVKVLTVKSTDEESYGPQNENKMRSRSIRRPQRFSELTTDVAVSSEDEEIAKSSRKQALLVHQRALVPPFPGSSTSPSLIHCKSHSRQGSPNISSQSNVTLQHRSHSRQDSPFDGGNASSESNVTPRHRRSRSRHSSPRHHQNISSQSNVTSVSPMTSSHHGGPCNSGNASSQSIITPLHRRSHSRHGSPRHRQSISSQSNVTLQRRSRSRHGSPFDGGNTSSQSNVTRPVSPRNFSHHDSPPYGKNASSQSNHRSHSRYYGSSQDGQNRFHHDRQYSRTSLSPHSEDDDTTTQQFSGFIPINKNRAR